MLEQLNFQERFKSAALGLGLYKQAGAADSSPVSPDSEQSVPSNAADQVVAVLETTQRDTRDEGVAVAGPTKLYSPTTRNIFQHPDAHPFILDLLLLRKYGPDWLTWEPETIEMRLRADYGQTLSDINLHKLQAVKTLHFVDTFWNQWEVFTWCTMALNGVPPDFLVLQVSTVSQCMIAVDIANRIRQDVPWSPEVKSFISTVFIHDGVMYPIEPLDFVDVPWQDYPVDVDAIKAKWPEVRASDKAPSDDSVTSEQLRRLLDIRGHLEESRALLRAQLKLVQHV
jgi:hypothetical protein